MEKLLRATGLGLVLLLAAPFGHAQIFSLDGANAAVPGLIWGTTAWADYDNDNDLDLIVAGQTTSFSNVTRVYRNDGGLLTQIGAALLGVSEVEAKWSDFDSDGDLDVLVAGETSTRLYRNDVGAGSFTNAPMSLPNAYHPSLDWGDLDNDGDNDLVIAAYTAFGGSPYTSVYRNNAGVLVADTSIHLGIVLNADCDWVDVDADGDLDLSMLGLDPSLPGPSFHLYENVAGQLSEITTNVRGMRGGNAEWADFDGDGDMDLLMAGDTTSSHYATLVYRNVAGTLTDIGGAPIFAAEEGEASWIDDDNDGDQDILITSVYGSRIARNNFGIFANNNCGLPNSLAFLSQDVGDYDGDADLDVVVTYSFGSNQRLTSFYKNNTTSPNTAPDAPQNLQANVLSPQEIQFSWDAATDAQTTSAGLSYRLWVGTSPNTYNVVAPVADTATGFLRLPEFGPIKGLTWTLNVPYMTQTYYACVQAIDGGRMGSPCSNQASVMVVASEAARPVVVTAGPNPTSGQVKVQAHDTELGNIGYQLVDLEGRVIAHLAGEFAGTLDLDLSSLPAGTYLLQLTHSDWKQAETLKLVRQ